MRVLTWAIRIALFILLLAFAARNVEPVTLRFYFDLAWKAPLIAVLLAFFAAGVLFGLMAMLGTYLSQRRELGRYEKLKRLNQETNSHTVSQPPAAEG